MHHFHLLIQIPALAILMMKTTLTIWAPGTTPMTHHHIWTKKMPKQTPTPRSNTSKQTISFVITSSYGNGPCQRCCWKICYKTDTLRDGNCLFRNLLNYKGTLPSLSDIDSLRNDLMDYILSHSENPITDVAKFLFCDIAIQNLNDIHKINNQGYNGLLQYTKIMRNSTTFQCEYGTMLEICASAHSHNTMWQSTTSYLSSPISYARQYVLTVVFPPFAFY